MSTDTPVRPKLNVMKAIPSWVMYTVYRVLMFAVPLGVLLATLPAVDPFLVTMIAAIIGVCLSYIFLRKPRERVATSIHQVRSRTSDPVHPDAASEDAAVDAASDADKK